MSAHGTQAGGGVTASPGAERGAVTLRAILVSDWYRPGRPVLRDVDVEARAGRVLAVVGPNGAGKSTLLRVLAGLRRPRRGRVELDGRAVGGLNESARAQRIALAPQRSSLAFPFRVREAVAFGAYTARRDAAAVQSALDDLDLAGAADEPVPSLSAGQQQRVSLARALAQTRTSGGPRGRVLLADEPVAGLDPRHAVQAMSVLRGTAARGAVVVVVLHDLTLAGRFADEALVLAEGGRAAALDEPGRALDPGVLGPVYGIELERLGGGVIVPRTPPIH